MAKPGARAARFEGLVAPMERKVYLTCLRMMGNPADAEDCAQDALMRAYDRFDSFKGDAQFSTWLYTLVTRVCLDALRKRKDVLSLDALFDEGYEPAAEEAQAYLMMEERERKAALKEALALLPIDYRVALVLVDLQALPYREAARALDIPEGTLKSRVSRARNAMYRILSRQAELFLREPRLNDERRQRNEL